MRNPAIVSRRGLAVLLGALFAGACAGVDRVPGTSPRSAPPPVAAARPASSVPPPPVEPCSQAPRAASDEAPLSLAGALAHAAESNPRLGAARQRWLASRHRPAQEAALPDPLLLYTEMVEPIQTRAGPIRRDLQIQQRIPYLPKLGAAGAVAREEAEVARLEYEIALRDVAAEIKVAFAELAYLDRALVLVEENQRIAKLLAEKATASWAGAPTAAEEAGEDGSMAPDAADPVTLFDTLKAQSQLAELAYDTITLQELRATEAARLNALLSRPSAAPVTLSDPPAFRPLRADRAELAALGRARRQEIRAAIHRMKAADHAQRLARLSRVPDFSLGIKYWMVGDDASLGPDSGDDALGVTLGVTLPIWARKNSARIAEAEHRRRAASLDRNAEVDEMDRRIARAWFRMQNAARLVVLYRDALVPQAESAMRVAESAYDAGRDPYGRLLEARSVWLNFRLAHARALADHEQAVARLEQLVGTSLGAWRGEKVR